MNIVSLILSKKVEVRGLEIEFRKPLTLTSPWVFLSLTEDDEDGHVASQDNMRP
jgi:hypothetical protein